MSSRQKHVRKSTRRYARERSRRLVMESLEARLSPAVYLVPADGSLPSVITLADNNSDAKNTIDLSPGSYAGGLVIDGGADRDAVDRRSGSVSIILLMYVPFMQERARDGILCTINENCSGLC